MPNLLGPFIGHVSNSTAKIWIHLPNLKPGPPKTIYVTLHMSLDAETVHRDTILVSHDQLKTGVTELTGLSSNTTYYYRLWEDHANQSPLNLEGLDAGDLFFRTLPDDGYDERLDFLLVSCHGPHTVPDDGHNGFAIWNSLPEIIKENGDVRFIVMAGDQVYADEIEKEALKEIDDEKRLELYLSVYQKYWSDLRYRKVLCSLPSVLIWDDHDITDGWGSREDSFKKDDPKEFLPEWKRLFCSAKTAFQYMQASRNPDPIDLEQSFDTCFRIGRCGFVLADLRKHRNVRMNRVWLPYQLRNIKKWVDDQKNNGMDTLFFVSPVVFSHGDPKLDGLVLRWWPLVLWLVSWLSSKELPNLMQRALKSFNKDVDDLRDDLNDSWGSEANSEEADLVLDFLFGLKNPPENEKPIHVVILSGDIHTPGYATLYNLSQNGKLACMPHIVASPVAYKPFSWFLEAIYRHRTKMVPLGKKGDYAAQISHHFCHRNAVVVSLRHFDKEKFLKVKYYLEGFPEPQIMFFDLQRGSHREDIEWPRPDSSTNQT